MSGLYVPVNAAAAGSSGGGGSGVVDPRPLFPAGADDFTTATLTGWTAVGTVGTVDPDLSGSWCEMALTGQATGYHYQAVPGTDLTIRARFSAEIVSAASTGQLMGVLIVDDSGNGMMAAPYTGSPASLLLADLTGGSWTLAFTDTGLAVAKPANVGDAYAIEVELRKVGNNYDARLSRNGHDWTAWSATRARAAGNITPTRFGFGRAYAQHNGVTSRLRVDYIKAT